MEPERKSLIDSLYGKHVLELGNFLVSSGRNTPYYIDTNRLDDAESLAGFGRVCAEALAASGVEFGSMYGIREKGVPLIFAAAAGLASLGINKGWFYLRGKPKVYGEATGTSDKRKMYIVGHLPEAGEPVIAFDDVLTTGATILSALDDLKRLAGNIRYSAVFIPLDREEVDIEGRNAIEEFTRKTGIPVITVFKATEIYEHLMSRDDIDQKAVERVGKYLRVYGTEAAIRRLRELGAVQEQGIMAQDRSIIIGCDFLEREKLERVVKQTHYLPGVGGYKTCPELQYLNSLEECVGIIRGYTNKPIIHDHKKFGSDVPHTARIMMEGCRKAGVNAVIIYGMSGKETQRACIYAGLDEGLGIITGGHMTHRGGIIPDERILDMIKIGAMAGLNNFTAPATKPDEFREQIRLVEEAGIGDPVWYPIGIGKQGATIPGVLKIVGKNVHPIIGREIVDAEDHRKAAEELIRQLYQ